MKNSASPTATERSPTADPDPSPIADAPPAAAESSPTASDQKPDPDEARKRRLADYQAMLATAKAMPLQDPGLLSCLEHKIHADAQFLRDLSSQSTDVVFHREATAQLASVKEQVKALQEQAQQEDAKKMEERKKTFLDSMDLHDA